MSNDFIQNAVNNLYRDNELMALKSENARLNADVNELADGLKLASEVGIKIADEVTRLKAEVERLRKAGDAMERSLAFEYPDSPKVKDWNAAKEGKPSV